MSQLIEDMYEYMSLWHDRGAHSIEKDDMRTIQESRKKLEPMLDEEGRELLAKIIRAYEHWADVRDPQVFKDGFQMGMQTAIEGMDESATFH